jgi:hypothetical protein
VHEVAPRHKRAGGLIGLAATALVSISAAVASVTTNTRVPLDVLVFVPCANAGAGELVELTGSLHLLTTSTLNGKTVSGTFIAQPQGVSGTGLISGDTYQGTGVTQTTFSVGLQSGQGSTTFINNLRVIGQASGNNLLVHETPHLTINPSGEMAAFVDNFRVDRT